MWSTTSAMWATTKTQQGEMLHLPQQQLGSGGIWDHTSSSCTSFSPLEEKSSLCALHKVPAQLLTRQLTEQSDCISVKKETREHGLAYTNQTGYQVTITLGEGSQRDHKQYTRAEQGFFCPRRKLSNAPYFNIVRKIHTFY